MKKYLLLFALPFLSINQSVFSDDCCKDQQGFIFAHGDWIFWNVRRAGLDFAVDNDPLTNSFVSDYHLIQPDYQSGFRVGLGVGSFCPSVEFGATYTRYCQNVSSRVGVCEGIELWPTRSHPGFSEEIFIAKSDYKIDYNIVDLLLSTYTSDCFGGCFRPFLGVQFAFIQEKITTSYDNCTPSDVQIVKERLHTEAYGLNLGFDYLKCIWDGCFTISVYTRSGFSFLVGEVEKRHKEFFRVNENDPYINAHLKDWEMLSHGEIAVGLESIIYQCGYCCLALKFGYEFHQWFNYPDFINFTDSETYGFQSRNRTSLGFDGIYIRLSGYF